jgi:hypothetical protein
MGNYYISSVQTSADASRIPYSDASGNMAW